MIRLVRRSLAGIAKNVDVDAVKDEYFAERYGKNAALYTWRNGIADLIESAK